MEKFFWDPVYVQSTLWAQQYKSPEYETDMALSRLYWYLRILCVMTLETLYNQIECQDTNSSVSIVIEMKDEAHLQFISFCFASRLFCSSQRSILFLCHLATHPPPQLNIHTYLHLYIRVHSQILVHLWCIAATAVAVDWICIVAIASIVVCRHSISQRWHSTSTTHHPSGLWPEKA